MTRDELTDNLNQMLEDTVSLQVWCGFEPRTAPLKKSIEETITAVIAEFDRLAARVAELEQAQIWIPVGERLPEMNLSVILWDTHQKKTHVGWLNSNLKWMTMGDGWISPTHWRPLAAGPEDDHE